MQTIKLYLVDQKVEVQILDSSIFTVRNRTVYSRPIKVYQGIDNPLQIIVKNQEQKKVDLTGYSVSVQIQDPNNLQTVQTFPVSFITPGANIQLGLGTVTLDKTTIDSLEQRFYKLTTKITNVDTNADAPLYVDDNYGVPLDLEVLPAYYSEMTPGISVGESVIDGGTI